MAFNIIESLSVFPKINPLIPVRRRDLFDSAEWVYEVKHDGFRAVAYVGDGRCRLISRRGNEIKRFADLSGSIAKELTHSALSNKSRRLTGMKGLIFGKTENFYDVEGQESNLNLSVTINQFFFYNHRLKRASAFF